MAKTDNNSKKFLELKELLEIVKNKIDHMEIRQTSQSATISLMKDQLSVMNSKLDSHTGSLMQIEAILNGYADMYKINDSNIRRMEKRLEPLEEEAGVEVPPEFKLEPLSEAPLPQ